MASVPVLTTARLRLRPHALADFDAACAMWSDPIVTRFIGGKPSTPQQTWARLLTYMGHWQALGFGYWAIELQTTGAFIGEIGFADFHREVIPAMRDVPELGFALASSAHGDGYATEAVRAVLSWGDEHLPSERTVCLVNEDNRASLHIVEKVGYRVFERGIVNGSGVCFLQRP
ncbi:MAG TPA: GNAT family N-acetyltransferase [Candidatus Baltobacteraceae bacterium]|nr:GNAT family N-acetyltransferase [Candidatus Baltobacteraceae bacterium]